MKLKSGKTINIFNEPKPEPKKKPNIKKIKTIINELMNEKSNY